MEDIAGIVVRFVVGELSEEEIDSLKHGEKIISKLIISPLDYELFNYRSGERIEVESENGNRLWCVIDDIELLKDKEQVIIILTLLLA